MLIHWFRRDLRLDDHAALADAAAAGETVLPVYVLDPALLRSARAGAPRLAFLLASLAALDSDLRALGARLVVRHGRPLHVLRQLLAESGARGITFAADYSPYARQRDDAVLAALPARAFHDQLLRPPGSVLNGQGQPYSVFTPFKRAWLALGPMPAPYDGLPAFTDAGLPTHHLPTLADLGHSLPADFGPLPPASAADARARLDAFADGALAGYAEGRNALDSDGTSRLSPYLRFGQLSIRRAHAAAAALASSADRAAAASAQAWISELAWREFYQHLLYHHPHVLQRGFRPALDGLPWRDAPHDFAAWLAGRTGYPLVDAAQRQLAQTGWMPNRARMVTASFLTKHLLIDWRLGERAFMQLLIDGDSASNNGGWQWAAGSGADAQPYVRIFNPILQSQKFDPHGDYIRRWVPELAGLPAPDIHTPWAMPTPPPDYPPPIVEHAFARARALGARKP